MKYIVYVLMVMVLLGCKGESTEVEEVSSEDLIEGTFLRVSLEDNKYYYCTDSDNYIEIGKDRIFAHYPMEDGDFNVERIKKEGEQLYYYVDRGEETYYVMSWVDKDKGIIQCALNDYEKSYYIIKSKVKTIENKTCEPEKKTYVFNDSRGRLEFKIDGSDYDEDNDSETPFSTSIVITNKETSKIQVIFYESNYPFFGGDIEGNVSFLCNDFNFDGLDDFAILYSLGGNYGCFYEYYFQNKDGKFYVDETFPLQHFLIVKEIDKDSKSFKTIHTVGAMHYSITIYKLLESGKWDVSSELFDVGNDTSEE